MTTMMIVFVIFVLAWMMLGFMGLIHCKDVGGINWWMLAFMLVVPFIPLVAHVCGLC